MRPLALLLLFATFLCGQDEIPPIEVPPLPTPADSDEPNMPVELPPSRPIVERDDKGRIYIPSDPNPNREPAFDEIVSSKESMIEEGAPKVVPESLKTPPKDDGIRVSVLGYHEFSSSLPNTAMRIQTKKFRKQMEALRDLGKPIISMEDFIKWKSGEGTLPPQSFLITIDDGWKSVYTDAFPVFKELNFPFTIFLYKRYVDGGGRALTTPMIEEMLASGLCTIGSHSVDHPFPSKFKAAAKKGKEAHLAFLNTEFGESKVFLEKKFGKPVPTYAYPGGYVTDAMFPVAIDHGYKYLFTVNPGMTRLDSDNLVLPRYIILGNRDGVFQLATTFRETSASLNADGINIQTTKHPVVPEPGAIITSRLPLIAADLSQESEVDPESIVMRVAGFGKVPAVWNEEQKTFSWQVNRPLRIPSCEVSVQWRLKDHREYELPMRWSFRIDLEASYQPR
ncbi:MAG: polysaccharide deacetylase family protein [Roseibacillus sp.]